jgi:AraC family transcriptional regulator
MSVVTPKTMSAWLGIEPATTTSGLHTTISAALWNIEGSAGDAWEATTRPNYTTHILWLPIDAVRLDFDLEERRLWSGRLTSYSPQLVRAGEWCHARIYSRARILNVYLPHALVTDVAREADRERVELIDPKFTADPDLTAIAATMLRMLGHGDRLARLRMDALGVLLCTHLLGRWSRTAPADDWKGKLGAWQKKRALAFLEDHLGSDIGLADIAAHVGLSQYHFNRAFKRTVGVSPHRYLLLRRLERAKELLLRTNLSVTSIATRIGYADHSQLGRLFRNEVGMSATEYRRKGR